MQSYDQFAISTLPALYRPPKIQLMRGMNPKPNPVHGSATAWERGETPTPSASVDFKSTKGASREGSTRKVAPTMLGMKLGKMS